MSKFPSGWRLLKLSDIADITDGTHKTPLYKTAGIPFLRVTDIQSRSPNMKNLKYISREEHQELIKRCNPKRGDILYSKNGTIGISKIIDWKWEFSIFVSLALIHNIDISTVDRHYLKMMMDSFYIAIQIKERTKQGTVSNLHLEEIRDFSIPLPSLAEQKKIAEILSSVDRSIEATEKLIAKLSDLKKALMQELFTKGLPDEALAKLGIKTPRKFKASPLGRIPEDWEVVRLGEVTINLDGKRIPVKKGDRINTVAKFPYYGASGIIDYVDDYIFDEPLVLIGEDGENLVSRNLPLAFKATGKYWVNNHAHVLRPNDDMNIDFVIAYLENLDFTPYITGSAQPKLNQSELSKIPLLKVPTPEQNEIGKILSANDAKIEKAQKRLEKLKDMKKGLMQDLLTGKIRVSLSASEQEEHKLPPLAFRRAVLAAEILHRFHKEPTMGRIKLQKLLYLCEKYGELDDLSGQYMRDAAGPFDNSMMRSIHKRLEAARWFIPVHGAKRWEYAPLEKEGQHNEYYKYYWIDKHEKIDHILNLFGRKADTQQCEIVATIYAAWNDLLLEGKTVTADEIVKEVYSWHDEKKEITENRWRTAIKWMKEKCIIPYGKGKHTRLKK